MIHRAPRSLEVLSISALDLFASALGVFILVTILLFPFYLKQPSLEADLAGARAELSATSNELTAANRQAVTVEAEITELALQRDTAAAELRRAEAARDAARQAVAAAAERRQQSDQHSAAARAQLANLYITDLDLVFVMDATGSMEDEIADVQANLVGIVRVLTRLAPSLRVGFVAYKDQGFDYVTRVLPLTEMVGGNLRRAQAFVDSIVADGGGDYPEAVDLALDDALAMDWRAGAQGRIIVVGDAPARPQAWDRTLAAAAGFPLSQVEPGMRRHVSAVFSGTRQDGREFFQRLALAGGGDFVTHRGRMMESVLLSVLTKGARE